MLHKVYSNCWKKLPFDLFFASPATEISARFEKEKKFIHAGPSILKHSKEQCSFPRHLHLHCKLAR